MKSFSLLAAASLLEDFREYLQLADSGIDDNYQGRHKRLTSNTTVCYDLCNGWNDAIFSLRTQAGFHCYFYPDSGCSGDHLWVPRGYKIPSTGAYSFKDITSSGLSSLVLVRPVHTFFVALTMSDGKVDKTGCIRKANDLSQF
ncbi:hypothetical protein B0O99DRAFT_679648 [Bisporella sp. PMI_857]|nr:hypothetical protein B0O99DRAFT_679648 [Bisporella sp. PMI_857]